MASLQGQERLIELTQALSMLEKRANNLERKIAIVFESKSFSRRKPVVKKRRIRDYAWVQKLADGTTIHGLKEVLTESHPWLHFIWTLLFCACLSLCTYHVWQVIKEYEQGMTITKIKLLRQRQYDFPVVLFCPDVWIDAEKVRSTGLSRGGVELALAFLINYAVDPPPYEIANYDRAGSDFDEWYERSNFSNLAEFFKYVAVDSKDFVVRCTFCDETRPFSFTKVLMYDAVCYQLPIPPIDGGSSLADPDIFTVRMIDRSEGLILKKPYWRIFVNPDLSLGMSDTHYLYVYPGFSNTVRIRPSMFKSLPKNQCLSNNEIARRGGHTQALCIAVCFADSQKDFCRPLRMYPSQSIPRNNSDFCHSYPRDYWGQESGNGNETEETEIDIGDQMLTEPPECFHRCPPPCEKLVYESSVEAHPLMENGTRIYEQAKFHFLNDVVRYFGVLSYEEVEPYSFDRLVSNVGGMLGLWLGASVVSLIQLPMLVGAALRKFWQSRDKSKKSAPPKKQARTYL